MPKQPQPKGIGVPSFRRLALAFGLSGGGALLQELIFQRRLMPIFGSAVESTAFILFLFMAGLGLGSFFSTRRRFQKLSATRAYLFSESLIAFFGPATVFLFPLLGYLYLTLALPKAYAYFLTFLFLSPPILAMGFSFPAMLSLFPQRKELLYSANVFGAFLGSLAFPFLLYISDLVVLQLVASSFHAAAAYLIFGQKKRDLPLQSSPPEQKDLRLGMSAFLLGISGLSLELVLTRALLPVFGSTSYTFAFLLACYLAGYAFGLALAGKRKRKLVTLLTLLVVATLFADRTVAFLPLVYTHGGAALKALSVPQGFKLTLIYFFTFACVALPMFPLSTLQGALFGKLLSEGMEKAGFIYAANALGAALSPLVALPCLIFLGAQKSLLLAALLPLALLWLVPKKGFSKAPALSRLLPFLLALPLFLLPHWPVRLRASGAFRQILEDSGGNLPDRVLFYKEGLQSTVAVAAFGKNIVLTLDGRANASTGSDLPTQTALAILPMLLAPHPRDVLVIGIGSGITLHSVLQFPVKSVDVVEIEPQVAQAARYFNRQNRDALNEYRVKLIFDDARHFLATSKKSYDVIVSEPSHPWLGANPLFTAEFYQLAKSRLRPYGVLSQWIPYYDLTLTDFQTASATILSQFTETNLFSPLSGDAIFLSQKRPFTLPFRALQSRFHQPGLQLILPRPLRNPLVYLYSQFLLNSKDLASFAQGAPLNRDLSPLLELSVPLRPFTSQRSIVSALARTRKAEAPSFLPFPTFANLSPTLQKASILSALVYAEQVLYGKLFYASRYPKVVKD